MNLAGPTKLEIWDYGYDATCTTRKIIRIVYVNVTHRSPRGPRRLEGRARTRRKPSATPSNWIRTRSVDCSRILADQQTMWARYKETTAAVVDRSPCDIPAGSSAQLVRAYMQCPGPTTHAHFRAREIQYYTGIYTPCTIIMLWYQHTSE